MMALAGLRVLDLTRVFAGPWATQMLADFGADVVKVEHPVGGDDVRHMGMPQKRADGSETGQTSSFLAMNRNKRSVALDMSTPAGQAIIQALAAKADVLIENFKTGGLRKYGLDYATLSASNPRLVYCSITGYGQDGPYAALPGYDAVFQAMSGLMSVTGQPDGAAGAGPVLVGYSVSDINAGFYATIAILTALRARDAVTGRGQHIDLALLDTQIASQSHIMMNYLVSGRMPVRAGTASQINVPWQAFPTADVPLVVTIGNDRQFAAFCSALDVAARGGRSSLRPQPRPVAQQTRSAAAVDGGAGHAPRGRMGRAAECARHLVGPRQRFRRGPGRSPGPASRDGAGDGRSRSGNVPLRRQPHPHVGNARQLRPSAAPSWRTQRRGAATMAGPRPGWAGSIDCEGRSGRIGPMLDDGRIEIVRMIRDSASAIAPRGGPLDRVRALRFTNPGFDGAVWRQMAELGWIGLRLPEAKGGSGLGMLESVALYEELGRGLVPEPLIAGSLAAAMLAATAEDTLLQNVLAGGSVVAFAWQGRADGIDPEADPSVTRLFVPVFGADAILLPAREAGGVCLRLLPAGDADLALVPQQDGSTVANLRMPTNAGQTVSGDVGDALAKALDEAALGTAGYLLGVAERAFEITLDYLKQRSQFGQALAAFQALQHRAADMKIHLTLTRASVQGAAAELDAGADPRRRSVAVSRAKARAADTAMLVGREAIQMHGAIGYADECDIGLFTRKAMVVANQYGSAMAHRRRYASMADDLTA